jgi:hypothetical protein
MAYYPNAAGQGTPSDDTNGCSAIAHINMVSEPPFIFWLLPLILTPLLTKSNLEVDEALSCALLRLM